MRRFRSLAVRLGSGEAAFTVLELLLVVALIVTLAAIGMPSYTAALNQARVTRAIGDIRALELDIRVFALTEGRQPTSLSEIIPYTILDPWGNPYVYTDLTDINGKGKARRDRFLNPINSDFDLYSIGPDGQSATALTAAKSRDDIVRANDGAFVGPAADF